MHADDTSLQLLIGSETSADPAFVFDGSPVSRAEFSGKIAQTAGWLAAQGIGKGDVVAVWLINRVEWIALLFAAARLGAVVAAVNTRYRSAEVAHLLKLSGARLLVVEAAFRSIDFASILADIARDEVPALRKLAVVGADTISVQWPCVRFDAFDKAYPPAPTQSDIDGGITRWIKDDEPLENTDVVLWYVFGIHHLTRPEDWPVMPVDTVSFWLKPFGFFDRNPALDVPPQPGSAGHGAAPSCH